MFSTGGELRRHGSIEARVTKLGESIAQKAHGKSVNIIAHSMGGLGACHIISQIKPPNVDVLSLTTIASPRRGSAFADYMFESIRPHQIRRIYKALEFIGFETGVFSQLTRWYVQEQFNPKTPDADGVSYFSYRAFLEPTFWSIFGPSHKIIKRLVSVTSGRWGEYKGTPVGVSHLDLINWANRIKWFFWEQTEVIPNLQLLMVKADVV